MDNCKVAISGKCVGQLKKLDDDGNATDAGNYQSVFILMVLEKIKED